MISDLNAEAKVVLTAIKGINQLKKIGNSGLNFAELLLIVMGISVTVFAESWLLLQTVSLVFVIVCVSQQVEVACYKVTNATAVTLGLVKIETVDFFSDIGD